MVIGKECAWHACIPDLGKITFHQMASLPRHKSRKGTRAKDVGHQSLSWLSLGQERTIKKLWGKNPQALVSESFLRAALRGKSLLLALPEWSTEDTSTSGMTATATGPLFKKSGLFQGCEKDGTKPVAMVTSLPYVALGSMQTPFFTSEIFVSFTINHAGVYKYFLAPFTDEKTRYHSMT